MLSFAPDAFLFATWQQASVADEPMEYQIMVKKQFEICSCRYLRRSHLVEIADNADRWDYNRQLDSEVIRTLPDDETIAYTVSMNFQHEHRYGEPCEPHMRLIVGLPEGSAIADVPLDYFDKLPKSYVVSRKGGGGLAVLLNEAGLPYELRLDKESPHLKQLTAFFMKHCKDEKAKEFLQAHLSFAA